jgi:hypothetical protein
VSGTCEAGGVLQVYSYPDATTNDGASVYYAWTTVPAGAAYVTFDSELLRAWERPIQGIVVFPVLDGPVAATLRAFGGNHEPLGDAQVPKLMNGARQDPSTLGPTSWTEPAGLTLMERCDVLPLYALNPGSGTGPTVMVFDRATRVPVEFDKRDFCRQTAALSPDPQGDIMASFGVANGVVVADYFEKVTNTENGGAGVTQGAPIPFEEAQQRIAAQHAARRF